jgi:autophagy-related protein 9
MLQFAGLLYIFLSRDNVNNSSSSHQKISLSDAVLPTHECVASLGALTWVCILVAVIFWILRAIKVMYHLFQFWDIKQFFNAALKIDDVSTDI